jgi:hypothetical protein
LLDGANHRIFAVYPLGTAIVELELIATRFAALTGSRARSFMARLDNQGYGVPVIMIRASAAHSVEAALMRLKETLDPVLPVAIGSLVVELLLCRCGFVSSRVVEIRFVVGFGPKDDEAFMLRYYEAIAKVPIGELLSREPRPPYRPLTEAIEKALANVGAFATALEIEIRRNSRRCTHSE